MSMEPLLRWMFAYRVKPDTTPRSVLADMQKEFPLRTREDCVQAIVMFFQQAGLDLRPEDLEPS
jgi:hypothetical protein